MSFKTYKSLLPDNAIVTYEPDLNAAVRFTFKACSNTVLSASHYGHLHLIFAIMVIN